MEFLGARGGSGSLSEFSYVPHSISADEHRPSFAVLFEALEQVAEDASLGCCGAAR